MGEWVQLGLVLAYGMGWGWFGGDDVGMMVWGCNGDLTGMCWDGTVIINHECFKSTPSSRCIVLGMENAPTQAGPQLTLYVPGPVLREGTNELVLLEVEGAPLQPTGWCHAHR